MNAKTFRPGSIVSMLGDGEISKLIAWCSDGDYSHVGLVVDGGGFIEAYTNGVAEQTLVMRCPQIQTSPRSAIHAARNDDGSALTPQQIEALGKAARAHVNRPYDTGVLVQLGMVVLVKRRLPGDSRSWPARALIRAALDHLVQGDREKVTCSELVYRIFAEAEVAPSLHLTLGDPPRLNQPFPEVDWAKFACEVAGIYFPGRLSCEINLSNQSPEDTRVERLRQRIDEVAAELGLTPGMPKSSLPMPPIVSPNPKVVQIPELITSPRFEATAMPPCPGVP